jgi:predicted nucleic acid-binding protein
LKEVRLVTRYPRIRKRIRPNEAGSLINLLRKHAERVKPRRVQLSPDPDDDQILGIALVGEADYLITGDAADLLLLKKVGKTGRGSPEDSPQSLPGLPRAGQGHAHPLPQNRLVRCSENRP